MFKTEKSTFGESTWESFQSVLVNKKVEGLLITQQIKNVTWLTAWDFILNMLKQGSLLSDSWNDLGGLWKKLTLLKYKLAL